MQFRISRPVTLALLGGFLLLPTLAQAQFGGGNAAGFLRPGTASAPPSAKAPPALPGAAARGGAPAPAQQVPTDMSPNDALFDSINRGDIAAARDALSRGAQLDAHNVLGMTPVELAVDLGRNDIAFLLLSMRNGGGNSAKKQAAAEATPPQPAPAPAKQPVRKAAAARPETVTPPAPPQQARLFAHDGGTPIPAIGFLGFDPERRSP